MKISSDEICEKTGLKRLQKKENISGEKFDDILQSTIERESTAEAKAVTPLSIASISRIQFAPIFPGDTMAIVDKVESLLESFEAYQKGLGDPKRSLKDLHPLVIRIERETEALSPLLDTLPQDGEIKDLLNRILIHSTVEIAKFRRGDYISA